MFFPPSSSIQARITWSPLSHPLSLLLHLWLSSQLIIISIFKIDLNLETNFLLCEKVHSFFVEEARSCWVYHKMQVPLYPGDGWAWWHVQAGSSEMSITKLSPPCQQWNHSVLDFEERANEPQYVPSQWPILGVQKGVLHLIVDLPHSLTEK